MKPLLQSVWNRIFLWTSICATHCETFDSKSFSCHRMEKHCSAWNVCSISGLNLTWLGGYLGGAEPKPWSGKLPPWLLKPEENKTPEIRFSNENQMIIKPLLQTQEGTIWKSSVQCQNWRHLLWWQPQDCEWSYTSKSPVKTAQIPSVEKLCKLTNVF